MACGLLLGFGYQRNLTFLANSNSLASQAVWQFAPALAATMIGALWTVVHRDLSLLECHRFGLSQALPGSDPRR